MAALAFLTAAAYLPIYSGVIERDVVAAVPLQRRASPAVNVALRVCGAIICDTLAGSAIVFVHR